ncbi:hypothetical protein BKA70DRAFT_1453505 [Coprinopsis sp. MPI-PUGE-AT-0042]|nr:hypothetical protein BKA70DRAFT_1453505 [Coprinopsis sp. MPI-PUGE-AT-0042]
MVPVSTLLPPKLKAMEGCQLGEEALLLDRTGAAMVGVVALYFILYGGPIASTMAETLNQLEVTVHVGWFDDTMEFFKSTGYGDFEVTWAEAASGEGRPGSLAGWATASLPADEGAFEAFKSTQLLVAPSHTSSSSPPPTP